MARKNGFRKLAEDWDMVGSSAIVNGPLAAARRIVSELQQEGPSWSGRFSNSWQVETLDGRSYKGDGQKGEPRPVKIPLLTGRQAFKTLLPIKDKVVYTISNFHPFALQACDLEEDFFSRPADALKPETQLGLSKWEESGQARPKAKHPRFMINTGKPGNASRTAKPNWFTNYATGGKLDKTVQIEMDKIYRAL